MKASRDLKGSPYFGYTFFIAGKADAVGQTKTSSSEYILALQVTEDDLYGYISSFTLKHLTSGRIIHPVMRYLACVHTSSRSLATLPAEDSTNIGVSLESCGWLTRPN